MKLKILQNKKTDDPARRMIIGKLRKGSPKRLNQSGKEIFGEDYHDGYRFDSGDPLATSLFERAYGRVEKVKVVENGKVKEKFVGPNWITIFFSGDRPDDVFSTYQAEYNSKREITHKCDGETVFLWRDAEGNIHDDPKPCTSEKCKQTGELVFSVRELLRVAGGDVILETHSWYDIFYIQQCLDKIYTEYGTLRDIPIVLGRRQKDVMIKDPTNVNKKIKSRKSLVVIDVHPMYVAMNLINRYEKIGVKPPFLLSDKGIVDAATGEILDVRLDKIVDVEPVDMGSAPINAAIEDDADVVEDANFYTPSTPMTEPPPAVDHTPHTNGKKTDLAVLAKTTIGPKWAELSEQIIGYASGGSTVEINALTDLQKQALEKSFKSNAKAWQAFARGTSREMPALEIAIPV